MHRHPMISVAVLVATAVFCRISLLEYSVGSAAEKVKRPNSGPISSSNNEFACDLYRCLAKDPGNVCCSPASIQSLLDILLLGADGNTEGEIAATLKLTQASRRLPDGSIIDDAGIALTKLVNEPVENCKLAIANKLWGSSAQGGRVVFKQPFKKNASEFYGAKFAEIDFSVAGAVPEINRWVSENTEKMIPAIIMEPFLPPNTELVAVNTIYFKGNWAHRFPKEADPRKSKGDFWVDGKKKSSVPTMSDTHRWKYAKFDKFDGLEVAELPYSGGTFSAIILLPGVTKGIQSLESHLSEDNLKAWFLGLRDQNVTLKLPKFRVSDSRALNNILKDLGMDSAFATGADFSRMARRNPPISRVSHNSLIAVNEEGTLAVAASLAAIGAGAQDPSPPVLMTVNRPFLFLVRDVQHGFVLFMARVSNPTESGETIE